MACDFDAVPGAEAGEDLTPGILDFLFHEGDFLLETDAQGMGFGMFFEVVQLALQLQKGFFKVEADVSCNEQFKASRPDRQLGKLETTAQ